MSKYIFITGGVVSSLGKGIASSSLAALLQARGYSVRLRKLDPYLNVDPGTMSPFQHGEVFVTEDGAETDLDLGHYERFTNVDAKKGDNITAGQIYQKLLNKERKGEYLGGTVQVIPHVTDLIKEFVLSDSDDCDFVLCEIGGTVGDIEGLPFFEAIRQLRYELGKENTLFIHLTLVPYIPAAKELKTKPTQHSVKELRSIGIQPDILLCRADREIPEKEKKKIALFCNIPEQSVISALDVETIYHVPMNYHNEGFDKEVISYFNLKKAKAPDLNKWQTVCKRITNPTKGSVKIGIVGKYTSLTDSYKSLEEALIHGGISNNTSIEIVWINARTLKMEKLDEMLSQVDAILVPGGFGQDGANGKMHAIEYARKKKIPYLGICFGMQLAVIEFAQNVAKLKDPGSSEFGKYENPVIALLTEWQQDGTTVQRSKDDDLGGTMRLGKYPCKLQKGSLAQKIYSSEQITERHRHRYEVNMNYREQLEKKGLIFSGVSPNGLLPEIVEIKDHPWFVAVQFHPEFKSRAFAPHPLFTSYIKAALKKRDAKKGKKAS